MFIQMLCSSRILCQAGRAGIHMVHVVVAYCIMLAVMTYNAWILIAVAIGTYAEAQQIVHPISVVDC